MVDSVRRHIYAFAAYDFVDGGGSPTFTFPKQLFEWQPTQSLRQPAQVAAGMNYAFRQLGRRPGIRAVASEKARWLMTATSEAQLDIDIDTMKSQLYNIGLGWLYTIGADGTSRRALAELVAIPEIDFGYNYRRMAPVILEFARYSDWQATTPTVITQAIFNPGLNTPVALNFTNPGDIKSDDCLIEIINNWGPGGHFIGQPVLLLSQTNPVILSVLAAGTTAHPPDHLNDEIFIDTRRMGVWIFVSGVAYNAYQWLSRPAGQAPMFSINPGTNNLQYYDQTVNPGAVTVKITYWPTYI